ncbi:hypothetical protein [Moorena producens]|uniref:hypothetical protein n=1 Tax=Moorena producens TaxID=1155739 RepID=UPI003C794988
MEWAGNRPEARSTARCPPYKIPPLLRGVRGDPSSDFPTPDSRLPTPDSLIH